MEFKYFCSSGQTPSMEPRNSSLLTWVESGWYGGPRWASPEVRGARGLIRLWLAPRPSRSGFMWSCSQEQWPSGECRKR